ncbi:type II secretion system protein [Piscinibacter defluvii]|uniref:type II secretion system protein n=1 Tax=Piscinibacter defluvii TaxID=1796922 RepID=UPI000FDD4DC9|nr:prepilin-type N-terminal cleavage/methylation domain-containing protein [Piscinibacter defluvii]
MTGRSVGFTVIELLVVLAAIALLLAVAAPRYVQHLDQARDVALKQNLHQVRDAIDKFYADQARYPAALEELVARRYLRSLPIDPVTQRSDSWVIVPPPATATGAVADIRSGAPGQAHDGSAYAAW